MNAFLKKFVKVCPKSGKIKKIILPKGYYRLLLPFVGLVALLWIAFRVIPKPSRAAYPCVKTATPFATSFLIWVTGIAASYKAFSKMKYNFANSSYFRSSLFLALGIILSVFTLSHDGTLSFADNAELKQASLEANKPMGTPVGIFPGRVVWVHNPNATNENCDPMKENHSYFNEENFNQEIVDNMLSQSIHSLTGTSTDSAAWDAIFKFHNKTRDKGEVGYKSTEKIFLKMNATSGWGGNYNDSDLSKVYKSWWGGTNQYYGLSETSPTMLKAVLRQLVNVVKVPQGNIYVGDPMKIIYKNIYEYLYPEFPNIHYLDHYGHTNLKRELAEKGTVPVIKYSDRGTVLLDGGVGKDPVYEDKLYKIYEDMEYMINLPQMKGHVRAGVTMFAKNHFGSHIRDGANHLHNGLMKPGETGLVSRTGYGLYRIQVDLMGHYILGKKNLVYLMDALWGTDHELNPPAKWQMPPFNSDYTSSLFASLDPVAIESVGYDFIRSEFTKERYPSSYENVVDVIQMEGVCDYLEQAADSANWPEGIKYDPEGDGKHIGSLGVHEHWNNPIDKEYSKNLGIGNGIELIKIEDAASILSAPSSLSAVVINNDEVKLNWNDNSNEEEGFIIERKENVDNAEYIILDTIAANQIAYIDSSSKFVSSYYYRIKAYNNLLSSKYTQPVMVSNIVVVGVNQESLPNYFKLYQNYPNPFNPITNISFNLSENSDVNLSIYDALGRLVKVLVNSKLTSGYYNYEWNGSNYSGDKTGSGIYFYKITVIANNKKISEIKKMLLVK